jgi:carbonic anhydrase
MDSEIGLPGKGARGNQPHRPDPRAQKMAVGNYESPSRRFGIIRNAGGRASDDAIRSLVISHKLLGTLEWFVIHHTNCGMELFCDDVMAGLLDDNLATASFDGKNWSNPQHGGGCAAGHFIKWYTIRVQEESVIQDIRRIREHPLVPGNIPIYGYVYDVKTGRLDEVAKATEAGRCGT